MTNAELGRLEAILRDHVGEADAISRMLLHWQAKMPDRRIRHAIHVLVTERRLPVCSSLSGGYFLASTQSELDRAAQYLKRYGSELFERARGLEACAPATSMTEQQVVLLR